MWTELLRFRMWKLTISYEHVKKLGIHKFISVTPKDHIPTFSLEDRIMSVVYGTAQ